MGITTIPLVSAFKGASLESQSGFRRDTRDAEVSHARLTGKTNRLLPRQCRAYGIEQSAQDPGLGFMERCPERLFIAPLPFRNRWQRNEDGPFQEISTSSDLFNSVHQNGPLGIKDHFLGIAIQLASGESTTSC